MKVFVTGATGMVGRPAIARLVADGHEVTAVARSAEKAALVRSLGALPVNVDLFDADAVRIAVEGHDAVINLATHIPSATKMMLPSAWDENNRIRTEVSRNLVDAALAAGAHHYVQESIAFIVADGGDEWLDEDAPVALVPHVTSTLGAAVVLRFGLFHGAESVQTQTQLRTARQTGVVTMFGPAQAYVPFIHVDDAGAAAAAALRAPTGVYNIVDDEPLTRREYAAAFAAALGRRSLRLPPRAMTKMGGSKFELLSRSQRLSNRRFREATGWQPRYPSAREALRAIVDDLPSTDGDSAFTLARVLLAMMTATSLLLAVWSLLSPHGFYANFPGGGRHWVSVDGPYNEHFIRDFGAFNLALAVVTAWAAARFTPQLARLAAMASLAFAVPHLAYHAAHLGPLAATSDRVANIVSLTVGLVVPMVVLALTRNRPASPRRELDLREAAAEERTVVGAR
jgi:nucleoside-diphosphate-sugar epimerase